MTVNSLAILNFLKTHFGTDYSKRDIADELGISISAVSGTMNSLIKKGYAKTTRTETVVEAEATETRKAKVKDVPYHTLTEAGLAYDPEEEERQKAAEKAAADPTEKNKLAAEKAQQKAIKAQERAEKKAKKV